MQLSNNSNWVLAGRSRSRNSPIMDTQINIKALPYAELLELGKLAAEAVELSREYDQAHARKFCKLVAACNMEVIERRRRAAIVCGTAAI